MLRQTLAFLEVGASIFAFPSRHQARPFAKGSELLTPLSSLNHVL